MSWIVMICLLEVFIDLCFGRTHKPTQCVSVYFTLHLLYPPQPARPEKRGLLASPQMERLLSPRKLASLQESIWRNYGINLSGMSMHHVHQCTDATFCPKQKVLSRLLKLTSFWQPEKLNIWGVAIAPLNLASCCTRLAGTCIHHKPWCGHAQSPLRHQITSTRVYTRTCSCKFLCPSIYIYDHIQSYTYISHEIHLSPWVPGPKQFAGPSGPVPWFLWRRSEATISDFRVANRGSKSTVYGTRCHKFINDDGDIDGNGYR